MVRVIRHKATGQINCYFDPHGVAERTPPEGEDPPARTEILEPVPPDDSYEVVDLPDRTSGDLDAELARKVKAKGGKGNVGKMRFINGEIDADPPEPLPLSGILLELDELRREAGKKPNDPLTWGDIETVTRKRREKGPK